MLIFNLIKSECFHSQKLFGFSHLNCPHIILEHWTLWMTLPGQFYKHFSAQYKYSVLDETNNILIIFLFLENFTSTAELTM